EEKTTPDKPLIVVDSADCDTDGSAKIANIDADLNYEFDPTGPTVGSNGEINGITLGTSYIVIAKNADGCESDDSDSFMIKEKLETPDKPLIVVDSADCDTDGSAKIANIDADLNYEFDPTGPTVGSNGEINGMTTGISYTVTAENPDGCESAESDSFVIEDKKDASEKVDADTEQFFEQGETLDDLDVNGVDLQWYAD